MEFEPGDYDADMVDALFLESQNGTPYIQTQWHIPKLEVTRSVRTYLSENALPISIKKLKSLGFEGDFENPTFAEHKTKLILSYEDYKGNSMERWDFANWGDQAAGKSDAKRLNAIWKKEGGATPAKKAPAKKEEPPKRDAAPVARDAAWDKLLECRKDEPRDDQVMFWAKLLRRLYPDKTEEEVTAEEWDALAKEIVPF